MEVRQRGDLVEATVATPLVIGVIADTHIPGRARQIPPAALAALAGSDLILHAGDLVSLAVLEPLRAIAPTLAVSGNSDPWEVASKLPARVTGIRRHRLAMDLFSSSPLFVSSIHALDAVGKAQA